MHACLNRQQNKRKPHFVFRRINLNRLLRKARKAKKDRTAWKTCGAVFFAKLEKCPEWVCGHIMDCSRKESNFVRRNFPAALRLVSAATVVHPESFRTTGRSEILMRTCVKVCAKQSCSRWQPPMRTYSGSKENLHESIGLIKQWYCNCWRFTAEARGLACRRHI